MKQSKYSNLYSDILNGDEQILTWVWREGVDGKNGYGHIEISEANAQRIVECVNGWDELVKSEADLLIEGLKSKHENVRLREALIKSKELIKSWHNMDGDSEENWQRYDQFAPEMKPINEALNH